MMVTISWLGQEIFFSTKPQRPAVGPSQLAVQQVPLSRGLGVMFIIRLHLVPRLKVSGGVPLLPLYAFMAWAGTILHFIVCRFSSSSVRFCPVTALHSFLQ
jgi:hypothetical protein